MALISLRDVTFGFGSPPLLDDAALTIEPGERIALVGRNGAGKSTLLRLLSGQLQPDSGEIIRQPGLKVAQLPQQVPPDLAGPIYDVVADGLGAAGQLLKDYHHATTDLVADATAANQRKLDDLQHQLDASSGWEAHRQVEKILSRMELDPERDVTSLSAGMKRRVLLAQALAGEPDLLLLDEPTNHLDLSAITWLEDFLLRWGGTLILVTHDRAMLRRIATRIVDLDRGRPTSYSGSYEKYLERKAADLETEATQNALFDKRLAEEEVWIRQGIKARRTRNEGRVKALKALRVERSKRRERTGTVKIELHEAAATGRLIVKAEGVAFAYERQPIFTDLDVTLMRGDKVGILGPNGAGKTTLLRVLLGELTPQIGEIQHGLRLEVAYFDQLHAQLDPNKSLAENVSPSSDNLTINGNRRHVLSYLQDFLFPPARSRDLVKHLSGGERNRLLLARLFAKPSNVLVLDEPTNDLDVETLELLEQLVIDYPGTVLTVSHDREFLNHTVTSVLAFEEAGSGGPARVKEYVGGYDDWVRQRAVREKSSTAGGERESGSAAGKAGKEKTKAGQSPPAAPVAAAPPAKRLSYKEQQELNGLPEKVEALEARVAELHEQMAEPSFYQQPREKIAAGKAQLEQIEAELTAAFARWESLEARAN